MRPSLSLSLSNTWAHVSLFLKHMGAFLLHWRISPPMASHSSIGVASTVASFVVGGLPLGMLLHRADPRKHPLGMLPLGWGSSCLGTGTSHQIQHSRHQPYPYGWTAAPAPAVASLNSQQPLHHCGRHRRMPMGERLRRMADTTLITIHAAKMLRLEEMITRQTQQQHTKVIMNCIMRTRKG